MKKFAATAAAGAVMLTGLAGASTSSDAAEAPASASASEHSQHVRRLVNHSIEFKEVSDNHNVGVDRLRSPATHKIVGYDNFSGVFKPRSDRVRFWLSISLKGGLIDSSFDTDAGATNFTGRITHGSGRFRGIDGTIDVRISDSGRTVYTLRYSL